MSALVARFADRLNPILVKEVRSALRGRWFKSTFVIVLSLAVVVSLGFLAFAFDGQEAPSGETFFRIVYVCAGLGINALAPFAALLSMTAESDEHTLELLQLSGISGWSIVTGKMASALMQAVLVVSAFLPFLTFAFLLQGVDASTIAVSVVTSLAACATQCALGILLGSLARARWARIVVMLAFGMFLLQTSQISALLTMGAFMSGRGFTGGSSFSGTVGIALLVMGALTVTFLAAAAARMAHREENRSTPVRVATTALVLLGCVLAFTSGSSDTALAILVATAIVAAIPMWLFATEREELPRAVAADLPSWARRFPFLAPWLPGGGLGVVFVLVHLAILVGARLVTPGSPLGSSAFTGASAPGTVNHHDVGVVVTLALTFVTFLLLVPGVLSFTRPPLNQPILARGAVIVFFGFLNLAPIIVGYFVDDRDVAKYALVSMPGYVGGGVLPHFGGQIVLLLGLASLSITLNVPRVVRAFRGVRVARERARSNKEGLVAHAATES